ncbi:hypothetical protein AAFF_G00274800 [Aldrovandia affinis]|uniref:Uncharacterized protein n=1 Tax=Aldrovandia affinis TaxID=143900 RepID=A0AAD7WSQ7_9TELE|nr:hypothetical protein AAFF_G00274800 [Aldrovandia affinis]
MWRLRCGLPSGLEIASEVIRTRMDGADKPPTPVESQGKTQQTGLLAGLLTRLRHGDYSSRTRRSSPRNGTDPPPPYPGRALSLKQAAAEPGESGHEPQCPALPFLSAPDPLIMDADKGQGTST